jgi:hypothetical protein
MRPSRAVAAIVLGLVLVAPMAHAAPAIGGGGAKITAVYFDPGPGSDPVSQLNQEYVVIRNGSTHRLRLTGWRLHDVPRARAVHTYRFPRFVLRPGKSVRIHTGKGSNTRTDLYWGRSDYVWGDDSDKATLVNKAGSIVSTCAWTSTATSPKYC